MKKLSIFIFSVLLIPQFVLASWWNPLSWFKNDKVKEEQILKERIIKLENEINKLNSTSSTSTGYVKNGTLMNDEMISTTSVSDPIQINKRKVISNEKSVPGTNSKKIKSENVLQSSSTDADSKIQAVNNQISFDNVLDQYIKLNSLVEDDIKKIDVNSSYYSDLQHLDRIKEISVRIKSDLGYLSSIKYWNNRPSVENLYQQKLLKIKNDYEYESKNYLREKGEEENYKIVNKDKIKKEQEDLARKASVECKDATILLSDIRSKIKPIQDELNKISDNYLKTGKYENNPNTSKMYSDLADLSLRESGALSKYEFACEGYVNYVKPSIITECTNTLTGMVCRTK